MPMYTKTQHGYLILADISGYSSFVAKSELEHAHDILSELLELILKHLTTIFTLSKLEGDAIFAYASEEKLKRGEPLNELVESTYAVFKEKQDTIHRRTTCQCNACRNISSLDLKFMVHYGDYIFQTIGGYLEGRAFVSAPLTLIGGIRLDHVSVRSDRPNSYFRSAFADFLRASENNVSAVGAMLYTVSPFVALRFGLGHGTRTADITERFVYIQPIGMDRYDYIGNPAASNPNTTRKWNSHPTHELEK